MRLVTAVSFSLIGAAADDTHWGVQGDIGYARLPGFVVDQIHDLPERPDITGKTYGGGLVRFHGDGSPSFALQYSRVDADLNGSLQSGHATATVGGMGTLQGFLATKYFNFLSRRPASAGIALGGGVGKLEASYVRSVMLTDGRRFSDTTTYDQVVPMFEILGQADIRAGRYFSVGPYGGFRNAMVVFGVSFRWHARR